MIVKLRTKFRNIKFRVKGLFLKYYLILHGCKVGKGLKCKKWPVFRRIPKQNINIGNNVNIGYRITFDIYKDGSLIISNNVNLTQDIIISAITNVAIGNDTLIAEFVSIRDANHNFKKHIIINKQSLSVSPINIGEDVWIGAGSRILEGANVQNGCVIAANSVVLKKSVLEENGIYAGAPVRLISKRTF